LLYYRSIATTNSSTSDYSNKGIDEKHTIIRHVKNKANAFYCSIAIPSAFS